jgi:cytochrome c oxidase subunit 2
MLKPASVSAGRIADLTNAILVIAAIVFVIVEALLLYTAFRYRGRAGMGIPKQIAGNVPLEIGWTSFPAIVLAVVFALTLGTLLSVANSPAQSSPSSQPTQVLNIRVIGHQWFWEFQYPDLKITTDTEMHIPVGAVVNMQVESIDVIHSFWVPELGAKIDAIPGVVNHTWYKATRTGRFNGQCSEFCGIEHALMRMQVVVDSPDQFTAWVKDQQTPVSANSQDPVIQKGLDAFTTMPCGACHTIQGTKAQGKVGPDLTHFGSRATFAGGVLENNPENLRKWLENPQAVKPGNLMPDLHIPSGVIDTFIPFLESLK